MPRPTVAEIDLDAIRQNFRYLRGRLKPDAEIMGVVKANACGHGAVEVSRVLIGEGVQRLAVSLPEEGIELRQAGIETSILVLGPALPEQADDFVLNDFQAVIGDMAIALALDSAARAAGRCVTVHLKFDTGMGRLGFQPEEAVATVRRIAALPGLQIEAAVTHFAVADEPDESHREFTRNQIRTFNSLRGELEAAGVNIPFWHAANSGGLLFHSDSHLNAARVGIALYGGIVDPNLREPMTLRTRIVTVRDLPAGRSVSYGRTFTTQRPTRVAVLPIGYADGYSRRNSNSGHVLIHGHRAPIIGRVCMDMTMVDVTDIAGAVAGDPVVLYGRQGEEQVSICDVAAALGTIPHEIMTGLGKRVPRVYLNRA